MTPDATNGVRGLQTTKPDFPPGPCSGHATVSIVICTQGLRPTLAKCLASVQAQNCQKMEIIVALNGPHNEAFAREMAHYPVRLLVEPRRGVCAARNTALAQVKSEIIAFLDDDVEAHPGWLHALLRGFQNERVACVTGRIVPQGPTYFDSERLERRYSSPRVLSSWTLDASDPEWVWKLLGERVGAGCNMAFRRSFLMNHTRFPENLGAGTRIGGADEDFMFLRVLQRGMALHHSPDAIVTHFFESDRRARQLRSAQLYAGSVAFMLGLLREERGIRWRLLKAIAFAVKRMFQRTLARAASEGRAPELLSYSEKLRASIKGIWIFAQQGRSRREMAAPSWSPDSSSLEKDSATRQ